METIIRLKKYGIYILLLATMIGGACTEDNSDQSIKSLKYGTSFGECLGYCKNGLKIEAGIVTYNKSGWADTIETITCSENLEDTDWNNTWTGSDLNAFFALSETIGCPDCADGGAEWIELELYNGQKHKVTFEYLNEPEAVKDYVPDLRTLLGQAEYCEE